MSRSSRVSGQSGGPLQSWADRLLSSSVAILIAAIALSWAWSLIRPLVPVLAALAALVLVVALITRRHQRW